MEKFEHLAKMFNKRTKRKDYENFIVNAIYNRVGNFELMPVTQQYVRNTKPNTDDPRKYYLMDLYFPQINYGIEVDEMQHIKEYHIISDEERDEAIKEAIGCEERRIELYHKVKEGNAGMRSFDDINYQINKCVAEIIDLIKQKELIGESIKWLSNDDLKNKVININKAFNIKDDVDYKGVTELYNIITGSQRKSSWSCTFKSNKEYKIWVPHLAIKDENDTIWCKDGWQNYLSNDRKWITEIDTANHLKETPDRDFKEKRVVFMKMRDKYGKKCCRFIGVFQLRTSTINNNGQIERQYERIATEVQIDQLKR